MSIERQARRPWIHAAIVSAAVFLAVPALAPEALANAADNQARPINTDMRRIAWNDCVAQLSGKSYRIDHARVAWQSECVAEPSAASDDADYHVHHAHVVWGNEREHPSYSWNDVVALLSQM